MKRLMIIALVMLFCASHVQADDITVEAVLAEDESSEPTDVFGPDVKKVFAFFKSKGSKKGDKFRVVWIAEDVGDAAAPDTKVGEETLTADKDDFLGSFSVSKPTKGWPLGDYRVDIYHGDTVATSVSFTIEEETNEPEKPDETSAEP